MGADAETLAFYDGEAAAYATYSAKTAEHGWLAQFASRLSPGAPVLDVGCGSGWAAHALASEGFRVSALDGSAGLAAEARQRYGVEVRVAHFEELDDKDLYAGIWASFCLLHDSREAMPSHLGRFAEALEPGGWLYLGLKQGEGESRDRLGRRYTYFGAGEMQDLLGAAGFAEIEITSETSEGYDGDRTGVLHILAKRSARLPAAARR